VKVWDAASGECVLTVPAFEAVYATQWSPDGTRVAMVRIDTSLRMLDALPVRARPAVASAIDPPRRPAIGPRPRGAAQHPWHPAA